MNREIKFRVYTEVKPEILGMKYFDLSDTSERNDTIMQFTGLHDKNGKEIYEGDIISNKSGTGFVEWDTEKGRWLFGKHEYNKNNYIFEVIGNIYQNPELLK